MQTAVSPQPEALGTPEPEVIVIGGGPVGARAAAVLSEAGRPVTLLSREAFQPYNRVKLTPLLSGDVQFGEIAVPQTDGDTPNLSLHTGLSATEIDRENRIVRTADGQIWPFEKLVIATGSNAFVPNIPGHDLTGVYTFRTAADASALMARSISARRIVVIGGGLLGLEAARGMQRRQAHVTVIEHEGRIMPRQLDDGAGALLAARIEEIGVSVRTGVAVREITGSERVEEVHLADGSVLPCDTVIICTGVRANIELARAAQLPIRRGIVVDDHMRTADPDIYAIGECAEHAGLIHGLVGPGFEQADVAVADILGKSTRYGGSQPATKLKVIGAEVFSVGEIEQLEVRPGVSSHIYEDSDVYRRIFIQSARIVGAIAVGGWEQASRVQNAVQQGTLIYPWMLRRFRREGVIWPDVEEDVTAMPDAATVCNCTGVTCGRLRDAMGAGAKSPADLGAATGAGNVCGSCVPLLEELVSAGGPPKPVRLFRGLLGLSLVAGLIAVALALLPRIPYPQSFDAESLTVWLWRDNIVKQWSGFILLGLTVAAMVIGLRKRLRFMDRFGAYDWWRMVHLGVGLLAAVGLVVHTGLRPGANLNLALFVVFTLTLIMGALAGLTTGGDHALRARRIGSARKPVRRIPTWIHIIAIWPLPVLLAAHVLASYAF